MKCSNGAMSWNAWDVSMALFPVLCVFSMYSDETVWCPRLKYLLETPGNGISETLKTFKMSLDASALRNLCLLC